MGIKIYVVQNPRGLFFVPGVFIYIVPGYNLRGSDFVVTGALIRKTVAFRIRRCTPSHDMEATAGGTGQAPHTTINIQHVDKVLHITGDHNVIQMRDNHIRVSQTSASFGPPPRARDGSCAGPAPVPASRPTPSPPHASHSADAILPDPRTLRYKPGEGVFTSSS